MFDFVQSTELVFHKNRHGYYDDYSTPFGDLACFPRYKKSKTDEDASWHVQNDCISTDIIARDNSTSLTNSSETVIASVSTDVTMPFDLLVSKVGDGEGGVFGWMFPIAAKGELIQKYLEGFLKNGKLYIAPINETFSRCEIIIMYRFINYAAPAKMIAAETGIHPNTVSAREKSLLRKLQLRSKAEVVPKLYELGLSWVLFTLFDKGFLSKRFYEANQFDL